MAAAVKVKLTIEYLGQFFSGWQHQPGKRTVQNEVTQALEIYLKSLAKRLDLPTPAPFHLQGSGRTDSGVHAKAQVASFPWPDQLPYVEWRLLSALNGILPPELAVTKAEAMEEAFDARFTPHRKCYAYRMLLSKQRSALLRDQAWRIEPTLDLSSMILAAGLFSGVHDFKAFRAKDCSAKTTVRTILASQLLRDEDGLLVYYIEGTGFLKQMVRVLVGSLVALGRGQLSIDDIKAGLTAGIRHPKMLTAPARGLMLESVLYLDEPYYQLPIKD